MTPQTSPAELALLNSVSQRLETLRVYRLSWWAHWAALAEMFLPRRYRWFVTPNQFNRGSPLNQSIVDETGVLAARTLATGLLSGLASPTKPWFSLGLHGVDQIPEGPEKQWLSLVTNILLEIYGGSNFYESLGMAYYDNVVFGSAARIQYEDPDSVVRFYNPCLGEFFIGLNNRLMPDVLYREYTYTVAQAVKEFGIDRVSLSTAQAYKSPSSKDTEVVIGHAIEPNDTVYQGGQPQPFVVPSRFKFREVYWEQYTNGSGGQKQRTFLRCAGFHEQPHTAIRWDVTSNDPYGRSPGMDALPATRQLQIEQRRKAEAIDKMVRPPMVASVSMKNEPTDTLPGGVTYVVNPSGEGFKAAYTVEPRIQELMEDLKEVQDRVRKVFHNDLFQQFPMETVRSAAEINAISAEKVILIGPVIERTENEGLSMDIARTFAIAKRRGLIPPPPPSLRGMSLDVRFISILAEYQRSASTTGIERLLSFAGNLAAVQPDIMDNINTDAVIDKYADDINVPPNLIRSAKEVNSMRAARAKEQQQAAALQTGTAAAQGAQTLSQTDVGGGKNALEAMVGNMGR